MEKTFFSQSNLLNRFWTKPFIAEYLTQEPGHTKGRSLQYDQKAVRTAERRKAVKKKRNSIKRRRAAKERDRQVAKAYLQSIRDAESLPISEPYARTVIYATHVLNRQAKRDRDYGNRRKNEIYWLKGQIMHYMIAGGKLKFVCFHTFPGGQQHELFEGYGFEFHRPIENDNSRVAPAIPKIEAKLPEEGGLSVETAMAIVEGFLKLRPTVSVFRPRRRFTEEELMMM